MNQLVEMKNRIPDIIIDMPYATTANISGTVLYPVEKAFLVSDAVDALARVQSELRTNGLSLLIWDAYRPLSVSKILWDSTPPSQHQFVSDPTKGSIHNRGCAVDLTLFSHEQKSIVTMPSAFDEFDEQAFPAFAGASPTATENRDKLIRMMQANGFTVNPNEWWHFDWNDWQSWPILDIPIEAL